MTAAAAETPGRGGYRLGFDVGGTFTDFVLLDSDGRVTGTAKVPTNPADIALGAATGIRTLLDRQELEPGVIASLIHATTQTSNTLIERSGPCIALIATEGFRDILEFGREARYDLYDLTVRPVVPLVPRRLRFEVEERLNADGSIETPLNTDRVRQLAGELTDAGVEAVAVCLLHGYRNGVHETRIREILREAGFTGPIVLSHETCPEIREYERA
ncbi:MAG: hydantoinase/oxoprolinase family protein, partial [Rhodospirillaceae bacterium]|nr:hydantoinase/oxoprolinase family protein [Rhodospirillaceae bacterium]